MDMSRSHNKEENFSSNIEKDSCFSELDMKGNVVKNHNSSKEEKNNSVRASVSYYDDSKTSISFKIRCYDVRKLEKIISFIAAGATKEGARVVGPVPMPKKVKHYTVNRSPHVYKKSREQFKVKRHVRLLIIKDFDLKLVERFISLKLIPAGLDADIKIQGLGSMDVGNE